VPKKIDSAVKESAVRLVREHRSEYPSPTAAADAVAVARQERLGKEMVRRWPCRPRSTPATDRDEQL